MGSEMCIRDRPIPLLRLLSLRPYEFQDGIRTVEATKDAEEEWVEHIISVARFGADFQEACTPGYYNNEGQPNPKSVQNGPYGKGSRPYFRITKAWREEGSMAGLSQTK